MKTNRQVIWTGWILAGIILIGSLPAVAGTVYLVRHAEKKSGSDPGLTETGVQRARDLAILLKDVGIEQVFSSPYRRTRETALPIAQALQLGLQEYDPRQLSDIAEIIRKLSGPVLVVGHSNTTPELVRLLGGTSKPMEEWEYNRVYRLQVDAHETETLLLHLPPLSPAPE